MTRDDATIRRAADGLEASARPAGPWLVRQPEGVRPRPAGHPDSLGPRVRRPRLGPVRPERILFANHPDLVEEVLVHQNRKFIKHYRLRQAKRTLGDGLLTSEGEFWRSQRKLAQPAFHRERIAGLCRPHGRLHRADARVVGRRPGPRRPGRHDAADAGDRRQDALRRRDRRRIGRRQRGDGDADALLHRQDRQARSSSPDWLPDAARTSASRRAGPPAGRDPLSRSSPERRAQRRGPGRPALDAPARPGRGERPADDRPAAPRRVHDPLPGRPRDHGQHPGLGLVSCCPGIPRPRPGSTPSSTACSAAGRPTLADLPRLPYTESVVTETLRLYPTVWMLGREAIEPVELGGYRIPAGTTSS